MKRIGKILISEELLLRWLDFYGGGSIRNIGLSDSKVVGVGVIEIVIEHPDMPEVGEGDSVMVVNPLYLTTQDAMGNKVVTRERGTLS